MSGRLPEPSRGVLPQVSGAVSAPAHAPQRGVLLASSSRSSGAAGAALCIAWMP